MLFRSYLRGRPATIVVDVARVRLAGKLADAHPGPAGVGERDPRSTEALVVRFTAATELLPSAAAVDSLTLLRVDALASAPRFAAALGDAIAALRSGRDATDALIRARRVLAGPVSAAPTLTAWDLPQ